jgi:hypothetical protein
MRRSQTSCVRRLPSFRRFVLASAPAFRLLASGALLFLCLCAPVLAEMCAGEYQAGARRLSPAERARELQRLEQERQREAERERERLAQEAQARQAREAALAARPLGVRLVEARCGVCHPADYFASRGRTTLGWWVTVLRMEALNGARIEPGERAPIVDHLARSHPATPARQAAEWLLAALVAAGFAGLVLRWSRRRR